MEPRAEHYVSQRLRLHYVDWGNPSSAPLILLHGGRDHARSWDRVAEALRDDYHVLAPDLRGHGDSAWSPDGHYSALAHVLDLAELIDQRGLAPVTIVAHSFGGHVALRYAGLFPDAVAKLVAIEGLGWPAPAPMPVEQRIGEWIGTERKLATHRPRRYATIADAQARMQAANPRLSPEMAHHLTVHGTRTNDDGSFSWKYDEYVRAITPVDISREESDRLWARIACPTLLVRGTESWAEDPAANGQIAPFRFARTLDIEGAGHWVHHDRLDVFLAELSAFLA